jgi:hypothetical protein
MADHAAAAAGRLRAGPRQPPCVVNAEAAHGHWPSYRRALCDSIAHDYEPEDVCR